ncbi:PAW domain-containing protein [Caenorhabditis elegans]|uniref:PAW domain-containing protein n=1 Tax=Caenorhabditis elegans TaxID=6239 RepID=O18170_CAEEL|nr:PAW domain-containing protein [Caenorhabditis elegans]CAB07682.4 PAW domain-containing protein [Caenorhabditis elegans]|eukprot:NP_492967.4 Uncharacterized protein CELE_W04G5.5 [Caenorhabditis elegans]
MSAINTRNSQIESLLSSNRSHPELSNLWRLCIKGIFIFIVLVFIVFLPVPIALGLTELLFDERLQESPPHNFSGKSIELTLNPGEEYIKFTYDVINDVYSHSPKKGFMAQAYYMENMKRCEEPDHIMVHLCKISIDDEATISWHFDLKSIERPIKKVEVRMGGFAEFSGSSLARAKACIGNVCRVLANNNIERIDNPDISIFTVTVMLLGNSQIFRTNWNKGTEIESFLVRIYPDTPEDSISNKTLGKLIELPFNSGEEYSKFTYDIINDVYSHSPKEGFMSQAYYMDNIQRCEEPDHITVHLCKIFMEKTATISWHFDLQSFGQPIRKVEIRISGFAEFSPDDSYAMAKSCIGNECIKIINDNIATFENPITDVLKITVILSGNAQVFRTNWNKGTEIESFSVRIYPELPN